MGIREKLWLRRDRWGRSGFVDDRDPFACVALASTLLFLARGYLQGFAATAFRLDRLLIAVVALVALVGALQSLDRWTSRTWAPAYVAENYLALAVFLEEHLGPGESWATDLYAAAYYAPQQPLFLFSKQGSGLFRTDSQAEVRRLLNEHRIRVVALRNDNETWWAGTVFLPLLGADATDQLRVGFWTAYVLNRDTAVAGKVPMHCGSAIFAPRPRARRVLFELPD